MCASISLPICFPTHPDPGAKKQLLVEQLSHPSPGGYHRAMSHLIYYLSLAPGTRIQGDFPLIPIYRAMLIVKYWNTSSPVGKWLLFPKDASPRKLLNVPMIQQLEREEAPGHYLVLRLASGLTGQCLLVCIRFISGLTALVSIHNRLKLEVA